MQSDELVKPVCSEVEQDAWMDAKQVQKFLSISASTFHFLMHNAGLPRGVVLGKRIVRYPKSQILEWLASRPASGSNSKVG